MRHFISIVENTAERNSLTEDELLNEEAIYVNDSRVNLLRNLGAMSLNQLIDRSPDGHVRGLVVDQDIYYWSAYDAVHFEVAAALGVDYDPDMRMEIWDHSGIVTVDVPVPPTENRSFQRLMKSDELYFDLDGKFVPGPEFAQAVQA